MKTKVKLLHFEHFFVKSRTLITLLISKLNYSMRQKYDIMHQKIHRIHLMRSAEALLFVDFYCDDGNIN